MLPRDINSSFIFWIAKCKNPQSLGESRPISIVGRLYKILAQVLANRMRRALGDVIDNRQCVVFGGRQLLLIVLVAFEKRSVR